MHSLYPTCVTCIIPVIDQALVNDIHTIQPSVNGINEVGLYLKKESEPPFALHIQKELDELNSQWENVCKQVCNLNSEGVFLLLWVCITLRVCVLSRLMLRSPL